ncbi:hypothetical protein SNEBB_010076 [Seison nebaliae]|nr:hypothetical protein SNEBB_010076 [Seison nebaliae]
MFRHLRDCFSLTLILFTLNHVSDCVMVCHVDKKAPTMFKNGFTNRRCYSREDRCHVSLDARVSIVDLPAACLGNKLRFHVNASQVPEISQQIISTDNKTCITHVTAKNQFEIYAYVLDALEDPVFCCVFSLHREFSNICGKYKAMSTDLEADDIDTDYVESYWWVVGGIMVMVVIGQLLILTITFSFVGANTKDYKVEVVPVMNEEEISEVDQ